jgi:hypothetical protein
MNIHLKRNLSPKDLINYKKTLQLTQVQKEILKGTLLGDASMSLRNGKPHLSVKFEQGEKNKDYVEHLFQEFEPYCGSSPSERWIDRAQTRKAIWFRTYSHTDFQYFYNFFYDYDPNTKQSKKIVPKSIKKHLTPRVLAYWYMDDGHKTDYACELNTQGFRLHEVQLLAKSLTDRYNLKTSVQGDLKLRIWAESTPAFFDLIRPYIHKYFLYKL